MKLTESTVSFEINGKPRSFKIIHNLPNKFGLSIDCALNNWLVRTEVFTASNFCEYIKSKQTGFIAMTEEEFDDLHKKL